MSDQRLLRDLLLDSLDTLRDVPTANVERSRQLLRTYLPRTGETAPYETYVQLLAEHDLMDVAKGMVEYHGATSQVLEIQAEPGEEVVIPRLAYPGDIRCAGHLVINEGVIGGRLEAGELSFGRLAVGSPVAAHELRPTQGQPVKTLRVADPHAATVFVEPAESRSAADYLKDVLSRSSPKASPTVAPAGPGETFH